MSEQNFPRPSRHTTPRSGVSRCRRDTMLEQLQREVTAAPLRRRRRVAGISLVSMLLLVGGILVATWPAGKLTAPVANSIAEPFRVPNLAVAAIFVGNRPQLTNEVVIASGEVDTSGVQLESISDEELFSLMDTPDAPVSIARIDGRLVTIGRVDAGDANATPAEQPADATMN